MSLFNKPPSYSLLFLKLFSKSVILPHSIQLLNVSISEWPLCDHLSNWPPEWFRFVEPFPLTWPNRTDCPHSLTSAGGHRPGESMPVLLPQGSSQCGSSLGKRGYFTPSSWQLLNMQQDTVSVWNCIAYEAWFSKGFIILKRLKNSF